jgi:TetR/AcrR family transcriptional regulator
MILGIPERRSKEKAGRRNAILKAAKSLIARYGVEGMSMNQLAESTELNKATLYLYFEDKDDLVDAVVYEGLVCLEKEHQEADRPALSGFDKVTNLVRTTFAFYKKQPVYFYALNHQERRKAADRRDTPFAAKGDEVAARIFDRIAVGLRQGIKEGSIRQGIDINIFMVLLYAQMYGVTHTIHAKEDIYRDMFSLDPADIEKTALEILEHYLKPGNGARSKGSSIT